MSEHLTCIKPTFFYLECPQYLVYTSKTSDGISDNPLKPNDLKKRRTAQLTSRCCILYIYSTNIHTEYFEHAA